MARIGAIATLPLLLVSCATGSFRRAGMAFGKEPVVVDLDDLTEEQIEALDNELMLTLAPADEEALERVRGGLGGNDPGADERTERLTDQIDQLEKDLQDARDASVDQGKANAALSERVSELEAQLKEATEAHARVTDVAETKGKRLDEAEAEIKKLTEELAAAAKAKPAKPPKGSDAS